MLVTIGVDTHADNHVAAALGPFTDLPRLVEREAVVGVLLGAMLAAVSVPLVGIFFGRGFATVVSLTLVTICTWASLRRRIVPMLADGLRIDPAVVSAPLITTLVDSTGLIIYFLMSRSGQTSRQLAHVGHPAAVVGAYPARRGAYCASASRAGRPRAGHTRTAEGL